MKRSNVKPIEGNLSVTPTELLRQAANELGVTTNAARLVKMRVLKRLKNGLAEQFDS